MCHLQAKLAEFKAAGFDVDLEFLDAALIALQGNIFTSSSLICSFSFLSSCCFVSCPDLLSPHFLSLPTLCHDLMCFFVFLSYQLLYCYLNVPGLFSLFSIMSSLY